MFWEDITWSLVGKTRSGASEMWPWDIAIELRVMITTPREVETGCKEGEISSEESTTMCRAREISSAEIEKIK